METKSPEFIGAVDRLHVATVNELTRRLESGEASASDLSNAVSYLRATKRTVSDGELEGDSAASRWLDGVRGKEKPADDADAA
jgi:hypothetical protein